MYFVTNLNLPLLHFPKKSIVFSAALNAVERGEGFYASHVYNPFFYQGTKTYAY
ncbi:hypothetical protein KUA25_27620 [Bacteroidales bacterium MSK.15.36]|nr:hypothetical protein [Bacteroidales bacterium MSK.15.36]